MAGYYFVFKIQQREIKKEFKRLLLAGIAEDKLVVIEFDRNCKPAKGEEIKFIENHEIFYKGGLYDIVRVEIHGSVKRYFCIADHDETRLLADLGRFVNDEMNKNSNQKKQNNNYKHLFNSFTFYIYRPEFKVFASDFTSKSKYHFSIQLWNSFPLVPPPKS